MTSERVTTSADAVTDARLRARLRSLQKDQVNVDVRPRGQEQVASGTPFWGDAPDAYDTVVLGGQALPGIVTPRGQAFSVRADKKRAAGQDGESLTVTGVDPAEFELTIRMWTPDHLKAFAAVAKLVKPRRSEGKSGKPTTTKSAAEIRATQGTVMAAGLVDAPGGGKIFTTAGDGTGFGGLDTRFGYSPPQPASVTAKPGYHLTPLRIYHPFLAIFGIKACVVLGGSLPTDTGSGIYEAKLSCREFVRPKSVGVSTPTAAVDSTKRAKIESLNTAFDTGNRKPSDQLPEP